MKTRSWRSDAFIVSVSLMLVVICAFYFFEFGSTSSRLTHKLISIGQIHHSGGDVRRRLQNEIQWAPISHLSKLYSNDGIYVNKGDTAEANLDDGTQIQIASSSLIYLTQNHKNTTLEIKEGQIAASLPPQSKTEISLAGKKLEITSNDQRPSKLRIASFNKETQIEVTEGSVQLESVNQKVSLQANDVIAASSEGTLGTKKTLPIALVEPKDGKIVWLSGEQNLKFSWTSEHLDQSRYEIEFSESPQFETVLFKETTNNKTLNLSTERIPKHSDLYWRVKAQEDRSSIYRISLKVLEAPTPITPSHQEVIYKNRMPSSADLTATLEFKWQDPLGSNRFELQISTSNNFHDLIVNETLTNQNTFTWSPNQEGLFYWRIRSIGPERPSSPWSASQTFSFITKSKLSPPKTKSQTFEISYLEKIINFFIPVASADESDRPKLEWEHIQDANAYRIEISETKEFSHPIQTETVSSPSYEWTDFHPGHFYWRVSAIDKDGEQGEWSPPTELSVEVKIEGLKTILIDQDQITTFRWNPSRFSSDYEIEISKTSDFLSSNTYSVRQSKKTQFNLTPLPTQQYVRIRALSKDGNALGPYSLVLTIKSETSSPLPDNTQQVVENNLSPSYWQFTFGMGPTFSQFEQVSDGQARSVLSLSPKSNSFTNYYFSGLHQFQGSSFFIKGDFIFSNTDLDAISSRVSFSDIDLNFKTGYHLIKDSSIDVSLLIGAQFLQRAVFLRQNNQDSIDKLKEYYGNFGIQFQWHPRSALELQANLDVLESISPLLKATAWIPSVGIYYSIKSLQIGVLGRAKYYTLPLSLITSTGTSLGSATISYQAYQVFLTLGFRL